MKVLNTQEIVIVCEEMSELIKQGLTFDEAFEVMWHRYNLHYGLGQTIVEYYNQHYNNSILMDDMTEYQKQLDKACGRG